ncbi:MAG: SurA N-terminal domain-containing protein, partial [Desulfuromonadales bacterium]|nr:SurA N-terminal domain-containing protein [Desulfuromonadales bacterium]
MSRLIAFSLAVLIAGLLTAPPAVAGAEKAAERVSVAKVNGKTLYQDQLAPILKAQQKQRPRRGGAKPEPEAVAQKRAIEQLIDVELLAQQARSLKVAGLEEKVSNRIAGLRHAQPAVFAEKSEAELRTLLAEEVRMEAYLQEQGVADPEIPEAEIRAFYDKGQESFRREETAHLRHITIQLPAEAS